MDTYVIIRRGGWQTAKDLEEAAARSTAVGDDEMSDDIRWSRTSRGAQASARSALPGSSGLIREHAQDPSMDRGLQEYRLVCAPPAWARS